MSVKSLLLAGAAAGTVAATAAFRAALRDAQERLDAPGVAVRTATTTHRPLRYAEHGTGPAVLVLHGNGSGWDQGMDRARRRLRDGRRVLIVLPTGGHTLLGCAGSR